jgi:RNA polymerase sigma factor (sigma-70 family)
MLTAIARRPRSTFTPTLARTVAPTFAVHPHRIPSPPRDSTSASALSPTESHAPTEAPFAGELDDAILARITRIARRYAMRIVNDAAVAKDIAQDVVVDYMIKARAGRRLRLSSLRSHLQKIVKRRAVDHLRRSQHRLAREEMFTHEVDDGTHAWMAPDLAGEDRDLNDFLMRVIAGLPFACRTSYLLVREEKLPYAVVAELLGVSKSAVSANVVRAQRVLRARLLEQGIHPPRARGIRPKTTPNSKPRANAGLVTSPR